MTTPTRILHFEDNAADAALVQHMLESEGMHCEITRVETRQDFIEKLEREQFDLILSDYSLPGYDVQSALSAALTKAPDTPFIFVSGTIGEEKAIESMKNGAADYVFKDRLSRLVPAVRRALRERQEIRERKEAEERYRTLFEESKDVVFISTPEGRFLDINPAGVELFGYQSKEELLNLDIARDLYWDSARRRDFQKLIRRQGYVKDFELEVRRRDGQKIIVLETTTVVRDPSGKIIVYRGILRDITHQKKLEEELRQAQKMETIGTLASGIAHDFNNILGIILGHISLLEQNKDNKEKFQQSIRVVNTVVQRGAGLTRQLLTFARKTDAQNEPVSVNTAVEDIVKILSETFPKTITATVELEKNLPIIVGDYNQLHQVFLNLCVNARDAMTEAHQRQLGSPALRQPAGNLTLQTNIVSGASLRERFANVTADQYVLVSVRDTGIGMDETTRIRIFDPFFSTKGKGTGLGLSVVYGVMKSHQGLIDVESELGKGTTFHLYFPVPQRILQKSETKPAGKSEAPGGDATILVVEDEETLLELVKSLLEEKGYTVITARDGQETVDVYTQHKDDIDLALIDMGLPRLSGWNAFRKMKEINPNVKVILTSSYLNPNVRSEMLKAGVKDFVQKPYDANLILRKICEIIDGGHPAERDGLHLILPRKC